MKVIKIEVEEIENAGCDNGNYPSVEITFDNGISLSGETCRCQKGCSGTWRLFDIGSEFKDINEVYEYMRPDVQTGGDDIGKG